MGNLQEKVAIVSAISRRQIGPAAAPLAPPAPEHQGQGEGVSCRRGWADRPLGLGKGDGWNMT